MKGFVRRLIEISAIAVLYLSNFGELFILHSIYDNLIIWVEKNFVDHSPNDANGPILSKASITSLSACSILNLL